MARTPRQVRAIGAAREAPPPNRAHARYTVRVPPYASGMPQNTQAPNRRARGAVIGLSLPQFIWLLTAWLLQARDGRRWGRSRR